MKRLMALLVSFSVRNFLSGSKRKNRPERIAPRRYTPLNERGEKNTSPRPKMKLAINVIIMTTTEMLDP